jgi:hypothetical protein
MNLFYTLAPGSQRIDAVEDASRKHREDCQLRLARALNKGSRGNQIVAPKSKRKVGAC